VVEPFDLVSATARPGLTEVVVAFSQPVELVTGTTTENYSFVPPVVIARAVRDKKGDPSRMVLTVSSLDPQLPYVLTVRNVLSSSGQALDPERSSTAVKK